MFAHMHQGYNHDITFRHVQLSNFLGITGGEEEEEEVAAAVC